MPQADRGLQQTIWDLLKNLRGPEPLKELFWSQLNYQRVNETLSRRGWSKAASEALAEDPVLLAGGGADNAFHVIHARLNSPDLRPSIERPVVSRLLQDHPYALFVFSNEGQERWHFVNVKFGEDPQKRRLFRRITIGPLERLRTASERIRMLDLSSVAPDLFGLAPLAIQERHDDAFDVEAVTKQFYEEYKAVFSLLRDDLQKQTKDRQWGHDYALQFLNRCMFLYFVQRKGWLGGDAEFLGSFWNAYRETDQAKDSFFGKWLSVLFFEAFNNRFHGGHRHFPDPIRQALQMAPFLNGGLFAQNDLDRQHDFNVGDVRFQQVLTFLERYNFTISEDSPLDQEVAVDPEMIGKVYESLVNVSEEADERGEAGIFYTPRIEIDLMCRLALVDNLANHLGEKHKNLLYEAVFAIQDDEKQHADTGLARAKLWPALDEHLQRITVADPACGSGSFLVGMLHILDDLRARTARQLDRKETAYDRKKGIIGRSLYGVDVMEWACHVAELRLWLALIIDVEMAREELHVRREPLLPHFSFKIRCGDSLVQTVGGISLSHRGGSADIPKAVKDRLRKLQNAKLGYYNNQPDERLKTETLIKNEEVSIFRDLLDCRVREIEEQAKALMRQQAAKPVAQQLIGGGKESRADQLKLDREARERRIAELKEEVERVKGQRKALVHPRDVPFVWDIGFAEVMESEAGGFDIIVGNPPYVRQESIAAPMVNGRQVTEDKKEYKAMLARSVYQAWPTFFGYKARIDIAGHKIDAKSDLYVYFYFHGLSLLNDKGSFCFITSNSWLDVGYGKDLQEFLLRHGHVKMVLDNQAKRSFASADVNTVIALLVRPDDRQDDGFSQMARFIMFKVPFEQVLSPVIFEEIEEARDRKSIAEYRLSCLTQDKLFDDGCEMPDEDTADEPAIRKKKSAVTGAPLIKVAKYIGNKWGGKYLRAPEIYWTLLKKASGAIARLGDVAHIRRGFTTGANEFFYLDERTAKEWKIEKRFLRLAILRPAEMIMPEVKPEHLSTYIFLADEPRKALKGTNAEEYICWGEKQGFHKSATCAARGQGDEEWYRLKPRPPALLVLPIINKMRLVLGINIAEAQVGDNCVEIRPYAGCNPLLMAALLSGSFNFLQRHAEGRSYGRMLKIQTYEASRLLLLNPVDVAKSDASRLVRAFARVRDSEYQWLVQDMETPDREAFDREWLTVHGIESEREQTAALRAIHSAVRQISEEMNDQEEAWVKEKPAARTGANPQVIMKAKHRQAAKDKR